MSRKERGGDAKPRYAHFSRTPKPIGHDWSKYNSRTMHRRKKNVLETISSGKYRDRTMITSGDKRNTLYAGMFMRSSELNDWFAIAGASGKEQKRLADEN